MCDEQYTDQLELDKHRLLNHCKFHKSNRCGVCHENVKGLEDFYTHSRLHTESGNEMSCVICRQSTRGEAQLKMHAEYHLLGIDEDEIMCNVCNKVTNLY